MDYVIGSGPAGISAAWALLKRGGRLVMLDAGLTLEPDISRVISRLGRREPSAWAGDDLAQMKRTARVHGSIRKLAYGSDYPYRGADQFAAMNSDGVDCSPSFARGGLSTVWGAAVLPYTENDISEWPLTFEQLARHYEAVLDFMPLTGSRDRLSSLFPWKVRWQEHRPSNQAVQLLSSLEDRGHRLEQNGITFGSSRLAVNPRPRSGPACAYCGLCMYGCPYELIYSSAQTLNTLLTNPNFRYIGNVIVEKLEESGESVTIRAMVSGERSTFTARRVFLGAGVIPTTKIMMASTNVNRVEARDSQYFLLPVLKMAAVKGVEREKLHTLAQAFIEINNRTISNHTVHLQVYTYNDLYDLEFRRRFGRLYQLFPARAVLSRLFIIQGYLHSDESSTIEIEEKNGRLHLYKRENARTREVIRRTARLLASTGLVPLFPALNIEKPGRGFHFGGTFPMAVPARSGESDSLGRPYGFKRVHIIDASVFPTIPATTITYSIMANAHRIASEADTT